VAHSVAPITAGAPVLTARAARTAASAAATPQVASTSHAVAGVTHVVRRLPPAGRESITRMNPSASGRAAAASHPGGGTGRAGIAVKRLGMVRGECRTGLHLTTTRVDSFLIQ